MPVPFAHTMRSLDADGLRWIGLTFAIALSLLTAWTLWFTLSRVTVYEVSERARLEVMEAVHPIQSRVEGRVVASHLRVGRTVRDGEVLVEFDADDERLRLAEEQTRHGALLLQIDAIEAERVAEGHALEANRLAAVAAIVEARAQLAQEEPAARLAEDEAARSVRLLAKGLISEVEESRSRAESQERRAIVESLRFRVERLERTHQTEERDRLVRQGHLDGERTRLRGEAATTASSVRRLENEIERRYVRAPVDGHLGEVAELRVGSFVAQGQTVGTIVPVGLLRIVAEFEPSAALGRVFPNQRARLRLLGFPWTEYGSVPAVVETVGSEVRNAAVRVELSVESDVASTVPLRHGLPGTVEVEVERVAPLTLVLRAGGKLIANPVLGTPARE